MTDTATMARNCRVIAAVLDALGEDVEPPTHLHPGYETPEVNWLIFGATQADQKARAAAIVRRIGGTWDKHETGELFRFRTERLGAKLEIVVNREQVCRRVVTGTREVTKQVPARDGRGRRVGLRRAAADGGVRMTAPKIRRDGKPARASRLGVPQTSLAAPSTFQDGEKPGTWHDLVLPGPKGNPSRVLARREERGQVTPYTGHQPGSGADCRACEDERQPVQQRRGYRVPTWATFVPRRSPKAAHVIHIDAHAPKAQEDKRTRCEARHAVDNSQPRTDVQRRRLERIARRAA